METQKQKGNGSSVIPVVGQLLDISVECVGVTPLLINRMTEEEVLRLHTKEKEPKTAPRGLPRDVATKKLYVLPSGAFYIPSRMMMSCLIAAGQFVRLDGKRQVSTAKSTSLPAFMTMQNAYHELTTPGWEVDIQQGKNPNGGEAVCLIRPRFDAWAFKAHVQIDTKEIGEHVIRQLWDIAGRRCGLGDFRPARKGTYGQFVVKCWERL